MYIRSSLQACSHLALNYSSLRIDRIFPVPVRIVAVQGNITHELAIDDMPINRAPIMRRFKMARLRTVIPIFR